MAIPVLTISQMRAWEHASWAAGVREQDVIARVGQCVASRVHELVGGKSRVLLLVGRGKNGSDVRAALPYLKGFQVDLLEVEALDKAQPDLERLLSLTPDLVVDGLFGIGLNRELSPDWCHLIETINAREIPVLAVDIPSGLNADSGRHFGAVINATVTLTVGAPKRGLVQDAAADSVGRLEVTGEVGLLPDPEEVVGKSPGFRCEDGWKFREAWTTAKDFRVFPPRRGVTTHKGSFGHLVIVAGSLGYHGAAVLAAKSAGAARPGLVTVITSPAAYPTVASHFAFAMVRPWVDPLELPARASAVLIGPGLAGIDVPDWLRAQTLKWWSELQIPFVVDASALDWLAKDHREWWAKSTQSKLAADPMGLGNHRGLAHPALRVITPHPGEAARWFPAPADVAKLSRFEIAQHLACASSIAVLKGHQTLVRGKETSTFINSTGNPGLAQGGTGDVLAGFMAGLLAQPGLRLDPVRTVRFAVWEHGAAADRLEATRRNWTAEDLAGEIGR